MADTAARPLPFKRQVHFNMTGFDVYAIKRALVKAGHGHGIVINYRLGNYAVANLKAFQKEAGQVEDGVYGPKTHAQLVPFFDAWGRLVYSKQVVQPPLDPRRTAIVAYWQWAIANEPWIHYAMIRPIPEATRKLPIRTDCSGLTKMSYHDGGAPSPDGLPWSEGNTDSLQAHGTRVASPIPGDCVFYMNPDHVGVYLGNGHVGEHGAESGPKLQPEWYRTVTNVVSYLPRPAGIDGPIAVDSAT